MRARPILLLLLCLTAPVLGQSRGSTAGQNSRSSADLTVRVAFENDRPVTKGVRVSLMSLHGGVVQDAFTNDVGAATFRGVSPGQYRVRVSGIDIETLDGDLFEIRNGEGSHPEWIRVKAKPGTETGAGAAGMVSAAELNIPDKARNELNKGFDALNKNEDDKAAAHFEKATEIYPQYAAAYDALGVAQIRLQNQAAARRSFETAASLNPKAASPNLNLARMAYQAGDYTEADRLMTKALNLEPTKADVLMLAAQTKLMLNLFDDAFALASKVNASPEHKNFPAAHLVCATVLERKRRPEEAVSEYKLFLDAAPQSPTAP
jgi:tetratricopeptide (TPR) repeat protein